ncbi:MAG TPA: carboxypeptidase-like regulatory domain-containing protein, partial [Ignavibacteriaceae bacterium]
MNVSVFMWFRILFLLLTFSLAESTSAQLYTLKGKITDSKSGSPIQGATVFISYNYAAYSNAEGYYIITQLNFGKYQIKISSLGYKSISTDIEINSDEVKDFDLTPSTIELDEVVVSTNRTENYLRNSPFAESLVEKEEIQVRPSVSLPDILQNEPGVSLLRDGIWGTEISI